MNADALKSLWTLAFGDPVPVIESFFSTAYSPDRCRYLEEAGVVTAALYWLDGEYAGEKYAYIYGVATHPDHRGKGLCRKLMEKTHEDLKRQGYAGALLMPAEPGLRRMYASFGYRECSRISEFTCCAAGKAVPARSITVAEYAAARRVLLPAGGLIQEKENLTYLSTYAQFYAGEGFVMAAIHEKDRIFVPELLGNKDLAPGILKAMGYPQGTFRVPGEDKPFAMYLPLREDAPMPAYLGLAFD